MYDTLATMATLLATQHSICMLLDSGSLLGAVRNNGHLEWDKDTDFAVFSTNVTAIESVLDAMQLKWKYTGRENAGANGVGHGFGYHVYTDYKQYIDLWLWSQVSPTKVGCVGINNGCEWWYLSNWKVKPPVYNVAWYSTPVLIPYGQWLMPAPNHGAEILDIKYSKSWKTSCGGWQRGDVPCVRHHATHPFVFDEKREQLSDEKQRTWKVLKRDGVVLEKYYVDVVGHGKVDYRYVHLVGEGEEETYKKKERSIIRR